MKHYKNHIYIYLLFFIILMNGSSFFFLKKFLKTGNYQVVRFHIHNNYPAIVKIALALDTVTKSKNKQEYYFNADLVNNVINNKELLLNSIAKLSEHLKKDDVSNKILKRNNSIFDITFNDKNFNKNLISKFIQDSFRNDILDILQKEPIVMDLKNNDYLIILTEDIALYKSKINLIFFMIFCITLIISFIVLMHFKRVKPLIKFK